MVIAYIHFVDLKVITTILDRCIKVHFVLDSKNESYNILVEVQKHFTILATTESLLS